MHPVPGLPNPIKEKRKKIIKLSKQNNFGLLNPIPIKVTDVQLITREAHWYYQPLLHLFLILGVGKLKTIIFTLILPTISYILPSF